MLPAALDLARLAPRSPRRRLGGYALGARMLDKCRAEIAGTAGEYHYNCPLDRLLLRYTGIAAGEFRDFVATGADDATADRWLAERSRVKHSLGVALWTLWWWCWPPFFFLDAEDWMHERKNHAKGER